MSETTYYQRNRETTLNRARKYYKKLFYSNSDSKS